MRLLKLYIRQAKFEVIAPMTVGITIYYFAKQMDLVILAVFSSLLLSIELLSFIREKAGKECSALVFCVFMPVRLGALLSIIEKAK
jgi:hypothetical protein